MPVSKAQQKSVHKYVKNNYDRMELTVPKGRKNLIKAHAEARGESTNAFIGRAILETMERDTGGPQGAAGAPAGPGVVSLPSETIKTAQEAAQAAGEDLPQFVTRAIQTQIEEDIGDRKADERLATMLRETLRSGIVPEKNRIIIEDTLKSIEAKKEG